MGNTAQPIATRVCSSWSAAPSQRIAACASISSASASNTANSPGTSRATASSCASRPTSLRSTASARRGSVRACIVPRRQPPRRRLVGALLHDEHRLADLDGLPGRELDGLARGELAAPHAGAVAAREVLEHEAWAEVEHDVVARDRRVVDDDEVLRRAPHGDASHTGERRGRVSARSDGEQDAAHLVGGLLCAGQGRCRRESLFPPGVHRRRRSKA
jgi:hypothetical protein